MSRLLVLIALLAFVWVVVQRAATAFLRSPQGRQLAALWRVLGGAGSGPSTGGSQAGRPQAAARLVPCARCRTHVPEDRALADRSGRLYCSEACRSEAASA